MYSLDKYGRKVDVADTANTLHAGVITRFSLLTPVDLEWTFAVPESIHTMQEFVYVGTLYNDDESVHGECGTVTAQVDFNSQKLIVARRYKSCPVATDCEWVVI